MVSIDALGYCHVEYEVMETRNSMYQSVILFPMEMLTPRGVCCRAIVPIPEGNIGCGSSQLVDTERQLDFVRKANVRSEYTPGLVEDYSSEDPELDLQDEEHRVGGRKVGVGNEVVPLTPEHSAAAFAKAIVDAAFRSGSRDNLAAIVVPLRAGEPTFYHSQISLWLIMVTCTVRGGIYNL